MSDTDGGLVFIQLTDSEARDAKIAVSKSSRETYAAGDGDHDPGSAERIKDELRRGFSEKGDIRLEFTTSDAKMMAAAVDEHARDRRGKGHTNSAPKYRSIADRIAHQLTMQGVMIQ